MTNSPYSEVALHPHSISSINQGHPWVYKDSFTQKFPPHKKLLVARDRHNKVLATLLHDPRHKKIKARVWSFQGDKIDFKTQLKNRLIDAIERRRDLFYSNERDNFYLLFGESDGLPGLTLLKLGQALMFTTTCSFWGR